MNQPKFLQIVPSYIPLTMQEKEDYFLLPARVMAAKGFAVEFLTLRSEKVVERHFFEKQGTTGDAYGGFPIRRFVNMFSMYVYVLRQRHCLVHAHLRPFMPSQFAALLPKPKIIRTFTYVMGSRWWIDALSSKLLPRFNRIFAVTPYEIGVYTDHGISPSRIRHIPLAIDYHYYAAKADYADIMKTYGITKDDFLIVAVANIRKHKRYDVLLEAFRRVKKKLKHAKLMIIGDDSLHVQNLPTLKEMVKRGRIPDVLLTGYQSPDFVRRVYAFAGCFVHTAENEFQGLVSYEAAAAGVPLCLSNIGSHTSVFKSHALYHDVEDYATLAENIVRCSTPSAGMKAGIAFLREEMRKWDYERIWKLLSDAYDEVIKKEKLV